MQSRLIEKWERIGILVSVAILIIVGLIEVCAKCLTANYPTIISIVSGLASGFIATIIVLYFERKHEQQKLMKFYSKYEGSYTRIDIGQDNTSDTDSTNMKHDNIGLEIQVTYQGGHEFSLIINYWKSEMARAKGFVEFNPKDKQSAKGTYRYTQGEKYKGHYGRLELSWDENQNEMIVFYHHQYPRQTPFNPDNNRGWEVWKKLEN